jgi:hypothetical protein
VIIQLFMPASTPVSLLESKSWFEIATQLADSKLITIFTSLVYALK